MSNVARQGISREAHLDFLSPTRYKRAVGVEYVENPRVYPNTTGEISFARARRLVVVSAGSLSSPNILERSGLGAKHVLEKAGIKPVVELPGVGENYQGKTNWDIFPMICSSSA